MAMTKFLIYTHSLLKVEKKISAEIMLVHDEQIL